MSDHSDGNNRVIKLKQPHRIKATYRIVTPMFIGDAQKHATGISPASIKGALRFWWRALNWGRIRTENTSDTEALKQLHLQEGEIFGISKQLHQQEGELFGTATADGKASPVTLQLDTTSLKTPKNSDWPKDSNDSSSYLGIGLWKTGTTPARQYIPENQQFSLTLLSNNKAFTQEQIQQLKDSLLAWGLFGGLGSRARRAFGSIAIEKIDSQDYQFSDIQSYQNEVEKLWEKYRLPAVKQPPFSAISCESEFSINKKLRNDARSTHAMLGQDFKDYRRPLSNSKKRVFGLPYTGKTNQDTGKTSQEAEARRASPLLFHIHPIGTQFTSGILFLPAKFHPEPSLQKVDYSLARDFLSQQETVIA